MVLAVLGPSPFPDNTQSLVFWVSPEIEARMGAEDQPFDSATEMGVGSSSAPSTPLPIYCPPANLTSFYL